MPLSIFNFHWCVIVNKNLFIFLKGIVHSFGSITYGDFPQSEISIALLKIFYFPPNVGTSLEISAIANSENFKVKENVQVERRLISLHFYDSTEH